MVNLLSQVAPLFGTILTVPYLLVLPWVFNKAISFNARMTSYRNVHFSFQGSYWRALGIFILLPLLVFAPVVVVGVLAGVAGLLDNEAHVSLFAIVMFLALFAGIFIIPFVSRAGANYIGNNTSFGDARFSTDVPLKPVYLNLGASILFLILSAIAVWTLLGGIFFLMTGANLDPEALDNPFQNLGAAAMFLLIIILAYTPFIMGYAFYSAGMRNISFQHSRLGGKHRLDSNLSRMRYLWIMVSNAVLTILSFALLRPWAAVRTWRYLAANTYFTSVGTLDNFINVQEDQGNVIAAEYLDIDGINFGL